MPFFTIIMVQFFLKFQMSSIALMLEDYYDKGAETATIINLLIPIGLIFGAGL